MFSSNVLSYKSNGKQKAQGCVRFTRKSYAMSPKIPETCRGSSNISNFLRRHHLFSGSPPEAEASKSNQIICRHFIRGTASLSFCPELK